MSGKIYTLNSDAPQNESPQMFTKNSKNQQNSMNQAGSQPCELLRNTFKDNMES